MDWPNIEDTYGAALVHYRIRLMRYVIVLLMIIFYSAPTRLPHAPQIRLHTSLLTGQMWVDELLSGHPSRIVYSLGVEKAVFLHLVDVMQRLCLSDSLWVTLAEQLAIFLHASVTGLTIRHLAERFQRSNATISL